uniref:Uncharacterized protein n=1 Tax=Arundo donax TaxID=35708 RepID=A0A0A9U7E1_ARUDO
MLTISIYAFFHEVFKSFVGKHCLLYIVSENTLLSRHRVVCSKNLKPYEQSVFTRPKCSEKQGSFKYVSSFLLSAAKLCF